MHIFHKWGKWEEYEQKFMITPRNPQRDMTPREAVEDWQKRTCSVCGYAQREEVKQS